MQPIEAITKQILDLYQTPAYQKLSGYYEQRTVFNVLGIERSEKRHSAFVAWLLNPESSHGLKDSPLRKFLALAATRAVDGKKQCQHAQVRQHLISGNYSLELKNIQTEPYIQDLSGGKLVNFGKERFDIWILLHISFTEDNDTKQWILPVVIENKIYSKEGKFKTGKMQTDAYRDAVVRLKKIICQKSKLQGQPLLIFLTPSASKPPHSPHFIHLTYQDLLDHVIQPCSILLGTQGTSTNQLLLEDYIRNLSWPSNRDDSIGEKPKDASILAIANTESKDLKNIFASLAYRTALIAMYPTETQNLLDNKAYTEAQSQRDKNDKATNDILEQFWNANEDLFKIVLYNQFRNDNEKMKIVHKMLKESNRDNSRYFVGLRQNEWINVNGKSASKSEASFLIFKAYCIRWAEEHFQSKISLEKLREAFPGSISSYYRRILRHLCYDCSQGVTGDVAGSKYEGKPISSNWDFYWDDNHLLPTDTGQVRNVKMWRKDDFDELIKTARKKKIVVKRDE